MFDVVIRGGRVVTPDGVAQWDVAIQGDLIAAIAAPGSIGEAKRVIDASGKLVVPGGIDPHVHAHHALAGPDGPFSIISGEPEELTRAAVYGGTTTLVDFAVWGTNPEEDFSLWLPEMTIEETVARKEGLWHKSYCDYALHVTLRGPVPRKVIDEIPDAISAGFVSYKVFMTDVKPTRSGRKMDLGHMWAVMQQVARHNGMLMVHAEDDELVMYMHEELKRQGRIGIENLPLVHSVMSEDISFRRIMRLARSVEGAALYMAHVSAKLGVDAIAEARAAGQPIYGETLPHYGTFTAEAYGWPNGAQYQTFPSLKYDEDRDRIWSGLGEGALHTVATDEVCASQAVKLRGETIFDCTGGYVGEETLMPIVYTEGVSKRGLSLDRFVAITSANAAKILGLYPRKGAIAPGSDADIVIFDPSVRKTLHARDLHESDYTIWEGREVHGWPELTMVRGHVVMERGQLLGTPGFGRRVPRKLLPAMQQGPAL